MLNGEVSFASLRREARTFRRLLQNYLDDAVFTTTPVNGKLLYIADSHELLSYISPADPKNIAGFSMLAERVRRAEPTETKHELETILKSEKILHELLFDDTRQTGLLPSHAEELDEEIAFHRDRWIKDRIRLLDKARDQVRQLFSKHVSTRAIEEAGNDLTKKRHLVTFFRQAAPALMALFRPNPDTSMSRIEALINDSNLTPLATVSWESFGFDAGATARLKSVRPSPEEVKIWRDALSGRRTNSFRSNRIDAEAMSFVSALNAELKRHKPPVRAVLVTRAMSLITLAIERRLEGSIRHPRLLLLRPEKLRSAPGRAERQSAEALLIALNTYAQQMRTDEVRLSSDKTSSYGPLDKLLETWNSFERARLTIDLAQEDPESALSITSDATVDAEFRGVVKWLQSDKDVERLVSDELFKIVSRFGLATFAAGQGETGPAIQAQVIPMENPRRSRVVPMTSGAPSLIEFIADGLFRLRAHYTELGDILSDLKASPGERYVAWATLFACQHRWQLADIYANSAISVASLGVLPRREADWSRHEAALLKAQISRLRPWEQDEPHRQQEAAQRFLASERSLALVPRRDDPRVPLEYALQILEVWLTAREGIVDAGFTFGFELVHAALSLAEHDPLVQARALALGVAYYLVGAAHPDLWPDLPQSAHETVCRWHVSLNEALDEQRRTLHRDAISVRARAVELLGFQKLATNFDVLPDVRFDPETLRIPRHLNLDVFEVRDRLHDCSDSTAQFLAVEIEKVARRLERLRLRDLIYAPIWSGDDSDRVLELCAEPRLREKVREAYNTLRGITTASQAFGVQLRDRDALSRIAKVFREVRLEVEAIAGHNGPASQLRFYVRMEELYARLLMTRIVEGGREAELAALVDEYEEVSRLYPAAAIPHFRLDAILSELQRDDAAFCSAKAALALITEDPFVPRQAHWVRSTIRRRVASRPGMAAERARAKSAEVELSGSVRDEYLRNVSDAFVTVYENFEQEIAPDLGGLYEIEARRRTNNVAYYGALVFEADPLSTCLMDVNFGEAQLRDLIARLHPRGIAEVIEPTVAHTIAYGYHVLGEVELARTWSGHLLQLIGDSGRDPKKDDEIASVVSDAVRWLLAGTALPGVS